MTMLAEAPVRSSYAPVAARATVSRFLVTGAMMGGMPHVELDLVVILPDGGVAFVHSSTTVPCSELSRLRHGLGLSVRLDPDLPTSLRIDWRVA